MSRLLLSIVASTLLLLGNVQAADETPAQSTAKTAQEQAPPAAPPPLSAEDQQEVDLGAAIATRLLGALPLLNNDNIQTYVNAVGRWVSLHSERPDLPWRFAVLRTKDIASFSTPGGNVFITTGLLGRANSEAELAGVLAHEIAHVTKKHQLAKIQKTAPQAEQQVQAAIELYGKGIGWNEELEADTMAMVLATRSGYDPYGLPVVLQLLESVDPRQAEIAFLTATSPPLSSRLNWIEQQASEKFEIYKALPLVGARFTRYITNEGNN